MAVMLQMRGETPDPGATPSSLHRLVSKLTQVHHDHWRLMCDSIYCVQVKYRGDSARVHQLSLASLLPNTGDYVTYEVRIIKFSALLPTT